MNILIRGQCECGRRYRIRNAQPDTVVNCPNCRRAIHVKLADVKNAARPPGGVPLHIDPVELKEAILIDNGVLRIANADAQPGATGKVASIHDEALLHRAMHGWVYSTTAAAMAANDEREASPPDRSFFSDLVASTHFAGSWRNAVQLMLTAVAASIPCMILFLPFRGRMFGALIALIALMGAYFAHFLWSVMRDAAVGDDELATVDTDPAWWWDGATALAWMTLFTAVCGVPAGAVFWYTNHEAPQFLLWLGLALAGGAFFWPVLVITAGLSGIPESFRPDRLLRTIWACGPAYLAAWLTMIATVGGAIAFQWLSRDVSDQLAARVTTLGGRALLAAPMLVLGFMIALYFGYIHFRVLGLLYRHYGKRFGW